MLKSRVLLSIFAFRRPDRRTCFGLQRSAPRLALGDRVSALSPLAERRDRLSDTLWPAPIHVRIYSTPIEPPYYNVPPYIVLDPF